ncbi:hybrid sensor histidine kinase/response regulator [Marinagarivorans cellulosilyticus]|uniref:Chemotaxis protein CheA n=1 Tax=Marinagarivorans cellulosilyticus TaxID=2721545 RepID=A0AAN1WIS6_9GAMM|nr:hybrid sensor histidine kinase/response regulator [Marinagarivorans cellulosilyticus]BCD98391.1 hypothetical protein MARGE09_P2592 [Marinagarivorans cellulosilyticus]
MAYDSLSADQQELLDLLRNEIADYVGSEPEYLWSDHCIWSEHFQYVGGQLEHLSRAVQMVGLAGLAISCDYLVKTFYELAALKLPPPEPVQVAVSRWPIVFLGYLQGVLAKGITASGAQELITYLTGPDWPMPLSAEDRQSLLAAFAASDVIVDEHENLYPQAVSDEDASLAAPDDVRPELLDGLITELPAQSESFSASIEHYIRTGDGSYLLTAQRVAHTIKGAGNVVGIHGIANLMHYCEDLLEVHQKGASAGDGFADLLLDAADCLANISDYLQGFAPAPDNVGALLEQLLQVLRGDASLSEPEMPESMAPPLLRESVEPLVNKRGAVVELEDELSNEALGFGDVDLTILDISPEADMAVKDEQAPCAGSVDFDEGAGVAGVVDVHENIDFQESFEGAALTKQPNERLEILPAENTAANEMDIVLAEDIAIDRQAIDELLVDDAELFAVLEDSADDSSLSDIDALLDEVDIDDVGLDALFGDELLDIEALASQAVEEHSGDNIAAQNEDSIAEQLVPSDEASAADVDIQAQDISSSLEPKIQPQFTGENKSANEEEDSKPQFNLTISDDKATDLLRVAGEIQIANTQILSRAGAAQGVIESVLRFQNQLLELAEDLDKRLAREGAMSVAAGISGESEMDPLELERYNELHSFASRLQEVTTDAKEAVKDVDQSLLELKGIVTDQRQMGFEMQNQVLGIRMLPASVLTSRFSRAVRQAARLTKKSAVLAVEGDDVMVDSRVLHTIADPILHLLRNAVDHGLETTAAAREANNKSAEGVVTLSFERVGESVRICVKDDGQGIDYAAIEKLAIDRGLIAPDHDHSSAELQRVILTPGFSTRAQATQTSGRGIGLDVVNDQVRQLKGTLTMSSDQGAGTEFEILVPMSVMSAHLLMVSCEEQLLGLISRGLQQIIYLQAGDIQQNDQGEYFYLLQDDEVPVLALNVIAGFASEANISACTALLITSKAGGELCGIAVEQIRASEEHVIKPLGRLTYKPIGVTGAAILGSGSIAAVMDVHDLPALRFTKEELLHWQERTVTAQRAQQLVRKPIALVVDDSLSARRALAQFMADLGYEVVTAKDGFEAIAQIDNIVPTVALIDLEMPRMNGLELAAHMRSQSRYSAVPIAMITSRTTARHKLLAENAGVDIYLNKPWSDDELITALTQLMPDMAQAASA